jgi:hypothetical protein
LIRLSLAGIVKFVKRIDEGIGMKGNIIGGERDAPILRWDDVADITHGPEEVLVRVRATAVSRKNRHYSPV